MKRVILIHSGICEDPLPRFEGRTPLQVARHPSLDRLARTGVGGMVQTIPDGCLPCSEIGTALMLGWSDAPWPARAPLEVLGRDLSLAPGALVFRANFMTVVDGVILDHAASGLGTREAGVLVHDLNQALRPLGFRLHGGGQHRVLLELTDPELETAVERVHASPPQDLIGRAIEGHLPTGPGGEILRDLIRQAERVLAGHDVNRVRLDLGENPATTLWPWGGGRVPPAGAVHRSAVPGALLVSDSPVIRGLGKVMGLEVAPIGRGDRRVSYADLLEYARNGLWQHDIVVVYCHRADDATHRGEAAAKIREIEAFDQHLVSPLAELIGASSSWKLAVGSDHRSLTPDRRHGRGPTPLVVAGAAVEADDCEAFHERALADGSLGGRTANECLASIAADDEGKGLA